ncbi:MAG: hypothetical protein WDW38_005620 [Sanguina aurantia]
MLPIDPQFGTSSRGGAAAVQEAGARAMSASYAQAPSPAAAPVAYQALGSTVLMGSVNWEGQQQVVMAGAAALLGQTASSGVAAGVSGVPEAADLRRGGVRGSRGGACEPSELERLCRTQRYTFTP